MVPPTIRDKLAGLRLRERLLRLVWGAARVLAAAGVLLTLACLFDFVADRVYATPWALRVLLLAGQAAVFLAAAYFLVVRPLAARLGDALLARWVERAVPFGHRLVTAVELNRPGAATAGMSPALIAAVTREAEEQARREDFARALDRRRWGWAAAVLAPVLAVGGVLFLLDPPAARALLARQALADVEIPRSVVVTPGEVRTTPAEPLASRDDPPQRAWPAGGPVTVPAGDPLEVRVRVTGPGVYAGMGGRLGLFPRGRRYEVHRLEWDGWDESCTPPQGVLVARVPAADVPFDYTALVRDGRLKREGAVELTPRPAVTDFTAAAVLPEYFGTRPDGARYERDMPKGDLAGFAGSLARVTLTANKPLGYAAVELLGSQGGGPEQRLREVRLEPRPGGEGYAGTFELRPEESTYRLVVRDEHGYANRTPPRRAVEVLPDEPPRVELLPERYDDADAPGMKDDGLEGIPIPLGGRFRVAYRAQGQAPLARAAFVFRVNDEKEWRTFPLRETVVGEADVGAFDPARGAFERTGPDDEVEFHAVPSADPEQVPGRLVAGGRFDFKTKTLPELRVGDKVVYYVEVADARPAPRVGKSAEREKVVVEAGGILAWLKDRKREREKLQALEARQSGLFDPDGPGTPK